MLDQVKRSWKISQALNNILNTQRLQHHKIGICFKGESSSSKKNANEKIQISYADILCNHPKEEKSFHQEQRSTYNNPRNEGKLSPGKNITSSQGYPNKYQTIFLGCCFHRKNFGHQAKHCKAYKDNGSRYRTNYQNKPRSLKEQGQITTYNSFDPLAKYDLVCSKCNDFNNDAQNFPFISKRKELKKEKSTTDKFFLDLCAHSDENQWFVDSGCSRHMTDDQKKFISLNKKGGNVSFESGSAKIAEKKDCCSC